MWSFHGGFHAIFPLLFYPRRSFLLPGLCYCMIQYVHVVVLARWEEIGVCVGTSINWMNESIKKMLGNTNMNKFKETCKLTPAWWYWDDPKRRDMQLHSEDIHWHESFLCSKDRFWVVSRRGRRHGMMLMCFLRCWCSSCSSWGDIPSRRRMILSLEFAPCRKHFVFHLLHVVYVCCANGGWMKWVPY